LGLTNNNKSPTRAVSGFDPRHPRSAVVVVLLLLGSIPRVRAYIAAHAAGHR
jgi:hypothetical protein